MEHVGRRLIGAEDAPSGDLVRAVDPADPRADRRTGRRERHRVAAIDRRDRLDDLAIAGASAEDATQRVEDLGLGRIGSCREQGIRRHEHPGCADPALGTAAPHERGLDRCQLSITRKPLDRRDVSPIDLPDGDEAGTDGLPIESDGAGAAIAGITTHLRTGQPEVVSQHLAQPADRRRGHRDGSVVDAERRHVISSETARRTSVVATSRRYAPVPRTSSIGDRTSKSAASIEAPSDPDAGCPTIRASAASIRAGTSEQAPTTIRADATRPSGATSITAATLAIEMTR